MIDIDHGSQVVERRVSPGRSEVGKARTKPRRPVWRREVWQADVMRVVEASQLLRSDVNPSHKTPPQLPRMGEERKRADHPWVGIDETP